jgi:hypothetical protein
LLQVLRHLPQIEDQSPEGQHAVERKGVSYALLAQFGQIGVQLGNGGVDVRGVYDRTRISYRFRQPIKSLRGLLD